MIPRSAPSEPLPAGACQRWAGEVDAALLEQQPTRGRRRRWVYAAAADEEVVVGVAAVDAGLFGLGTMFAFAVDETGTHLYDAGPGRAGAVGGLDGTAHVRRRRALVRIDDGSFELSVPVAGGRIEASVEACDQRPVSLVTATPAGGWNATTKLAGYPVRGTVRTPGGDRTLDGLGWADHTDGRQDAHTTWRWAAGAGRSADGRAVGLQASTGMNAVGPGEDLLWVEGVAHPLPVEVLAPAGADARGDWVVAGPGWQLDFTPDGVRAADEGIGPIRSSYVQPIGTFRGTVPDADGRPVQVTLRGVTEDHEARW